MRIEKFGRELPMGILEPLVCLVCIFAAHSVAFKPVDNYLIDCGSSTNTELDDGRTFLSDSKSSSLLSARHAIAATMAKGASVPSVLYSTAIIFREPSEYHFDIKQKGRHWIRLYFYPIPKQSYNLKTAVFSVTTDTFVLLNNASIKNSSFWFKEYVVNVTSDGLVLKFAPSQSSVAFVNAIEVVSLPDDLLPDQADSLPPLSTFTGLPEMAFETVYRINMGGPKITPKNDTLGRTWLPDQSYLVIKDAAQNVSVDPSTINYSSTVSQEIAPNWVYATAEQMADARVSNAKFNISWTFPVDPSFNYFVRMHFCDIVSKTLNQLYFNVYINNQSAIVDLDLSTVTYGLATPYYVDYVATASVGSKSLSIRAGPGDLQNIPVNAILNGLEILKMSNAVNSLDGSYTSNGTLPADTKSSRKILVIVGPIVGAVVVIGLSVVAYCLYCRRGGKAKHNPPSWLPLPLLGGHSDIMTSRGSTASRKSATGSYVSTAHSSLGRFFTFAEIQEATKNFDEKLILGTGGFGKVYMGELEDGTKVAIKRGNPRSEQGITEFQTEIDMLSKLRHRHLVSLIGYCEERCEMILVYEYMANGPLRNHLYGSDLPILSWKQRLEICIGAARGLHYLHTGAAQGIIHRDVKTTNILLDENFVAKVSDFGLSKTGPALDQTHVSTAVKGSFGYLDPEYFRRQQLTEKSDVYSFGVVLMEVLCARPAINPALPRDQVNIAEWAMHWQNKGMLEQIVDSKIAGTISPGSLRKFGESAEKCLAEQGIDRPSMGDVLWNLEYVLQLQEAVMQNEPDDNSTNCIGELPLPLPEPKNLDNSIVEKGSGVSDEDSETTTTSAVFSQLVNPQGR